MQKFAQFFIFDMKFIMQTNICLKTQEFPAQEKHLSVRFLCEGNGDKLTGDIIKTISQITSGLTDSLGIDPRVLLSSLMGSKLAGIGGKTEPKQING